MRKKQVVTPSIEPRVVQGEIEILRRDKGYLLDTLERLAAVEPDRLDHGMDVALIERMRGFAQNALANVQR